MLQCFIITSFEFRKWCILNQSLYLKSLKVTSLGEARSLYRVYIRKGILKPDTFRAHKKAIHIAFAKFTFENLFLNVTSLP